MAKNHVVQVKPEPFVAADGRLEVHCLPAAQDNLIWLARCLGSGVVAVIDGPNAQPVLALCQEQGWQVDLLLNTHHHHDHIGLNRDLKKAFPDLQVVGAAQKAEAIPEISRKVQDGDTVMLGDVEGQVMLTEGHVDGHLSFLFDDLLFCGDTLFGGGCGYLFDGPPTKMHHSLQRLAALDENTKVCCAHEYTQDNLHFAQSVDGDNAALKARIADVLQKRGRGECTLPSSIGLEKATNPFIRTDEPGLRAAAQASAEEDAAQVFARLRALKDSKAYRNTPL